MTAEAAAALQRVRAELNQLGREAAEFLARHNPDCECEWGEATITAVQRIRAAINNTERTSP